MFKYLCETCTNISPTKLLNACTSAKDIKRHSCCIFAPFDKGYVNTYMSLANNKFVVNS